MTHYFIKNPLQKNGVTTLIHINFKHPIPWWLKLKIWAVDKVFRGYFRIVINARIYGPSPVLGPNAMVGPRRYPVTDVDKMVVAPAKNKQKKSWRKSSTKSRRASRK